MKKFNLFTLLATLGLFGSYIADGEGAGSEGSNDDGSDSGSGEGDSNSRDKELDDDNLDDSKNDDLSDIKKELEDLRKDKQERDKAAAYNSAISEVTKIYPDFDADKVKGKLKELNKENPGLGDKYNTPAGWEAIWQRFFQTKPVDNDDFDPGRKESQKFDFNEAMEKAAKGDDASIEALLNNSISTNQ